MRIYKVEVMESWNGKDAGSATLGVYPDIFGAVEAADYHYQKASFGELNPDAGHKAKWRQYYIHEFEVRDDAFTEYIGFICRSERAEGKTIKTRGVRQGVNLRWEFAIPKKSIASRVFAE